MSSADNDTEVRIAIRDMEMADVDPVWRLEQQVFPDPWPKTAFREQIDGAGWGAVVAEVNGRVVAYGCYFVVDIEAHLTNIAVAPEYRRKSVAKRLLDTILERATEAGCDYLLLEVRQSNTAARTFYEKHGFTVLYQRPNYYRHPVEGAVVMVRYLTPNKEV